MIKIVNITKKFRPNFWEKEFIALDNVSFEINKGELVGFLGANGAGKTTLIKCLMDFSKQDCGEIIFGEELGGNSKNAKFKMGYLPEKTYIYQYLTGREFLTYTGNIYGIGPSELNNKILVWSERLKMSYALDRQIKTYSKGMQQRIGFISAVMNDPEFVILDEPLSGLDPVGRKDFKNIFKELNEKGTTIFFSSHVVSDVEELCDKVVFLEKGKLVYSGSIEDILKMHHQDKYTLTYKQNNDLLEIEVNGEDKNKIIEKIIRDGLEIVELTRNSISLEEIIYKIKK